MKIVDVLYDSKICSLVYMQDLSKLINYERDQNDQGSFQFANQHLLELIQGDIKQSQKIVE